MVACKGFQQFMLGALNESEQSHKRHHSSIRIYLDASDRSPTQIIIMATYELLWLKSQGDLISGPRKTSTQIMSSEMFLSPFLCFAFLCIGFILREAFNHSNQ